MHCFSSALFNIKFERKREFYIANNSRASARGLLDTSTKVEGFIAYKLSRVVNSHPPRLFHQTTLHPSRRSSPLQPGNSHQKILDGCQVGSANWQVWSHAESHVPCCAPLVVSRGMRDCTTWRAVSRVGVTWPSGVLYIEITCASAIKSSNIMLFC